MDSRILYANVERGEKREPCVSREEWEAFFAPYPDSVRYTAANLAAHNWDVAVIDARLVVACAGTFMGTWFDLDGTETRLTDDEFDLLYPVAPADKRYSKGYCYDHKRGLCRQYSLQMPSAAPEVAVMLDPDMPTGELLLHMGEMSSLDVARAREAIRRSNEGRGPGTRANAAQAAWRWAERVKRGQSKVAS